MWSMNMEMVENLFIIFLDYIAESKIIFIKEKSKCFFYDFNNISIDTVKWFVGIMGVFMAIFNDG